MKLPNYFHYLKKRCRANSGRRSIAFPEAQDMRVMVAAKVLLLEGIFDRVWLFISKEQGVALANQWGIDLFEVMDGIEWVSSPAILAGDVRKFLQLRRQGKTERNLEEWSVSPLYQAGYLVSQRRVSVVLAGATFTTAEVIRAGMRTVGLGADLKYVSGSFMMVSNDDDQRSILFADCGVNVDPLSLQLVEIAESSVDTWQTLTDIEPVVAFLSFSTLGSAQHEKAKKMAEAYRIFSKKNPDISCMGEVQFDASWDPDVGRRKGLHKTYSSGANIFIFPNLDAGNIAYKMAQYLAGYGAYGPILQGLKHPYSDLSRGCRTEDIIVSACLNQLRCLD